MDQATLAQRIEKNLKKDLSPDSSLLYDTVIIGKGVVGYATAMYAGRLGLKTLVVGELKGGTITKTHVVENYPGFLSLTGPELAEKMEVHAKDYDIHALNSSVKSIKKLKSSFQVETKKGIFKTKTVIFATGSKWRKLGVSGEAEFENRGVSYCALCDAPLFKGDVVGVVGGSDSAVKEALLLAEYAKKVYILYRGEKVHPEPINLRRLEEKIRSKKVEVISNTNVVEVIGEQMMTGVILDRPFQGSTTLALAGLFIDIGHIPLSDLAVSIGVKVNKKKEIKINRKAETNVMGVYAAGDVCDTDFKQAITGVGEGVQAAYHVYDYVQSLQ